jgi:hypothetical protein
MIYIQWHSHWIYIMLPLPYTIYHWIYIMLPLLYTIPLNIYHATITLYYTTEYISCYRYLILYTTEYISCYRYLMLYQAWYIFSEYNASINKNTAKWFCYGQYLIVKDQINKKNSTKANYKTDKQTRTQTNKTK